MILWADGWDIPKGDKGRRVARYLKRWGFDVGYWSIAGQRLWSQPFWYSITGRQRLVLARVINKDLADFYETARGV